MKNNFQNVFKEDFDRFYNIANIAEIGINHNGDIDLAKELIRVKVEGLYKPNYRY